MASILVGLPAKRTVQVLSEDDRVLANFEFPPTAIVTEVKEALRDKKGVPFYSQRLLRYVGVGKLPVHDDEALEFFPHPIKFLLVVTPYVEDPASSLLAAVNRGDVATTEKLLRAPVFPYVKDSDGYSALMISIEIGNRELLKILLRAGQDVDIMCEARNQEETYTTPLHSASRQGHEDAVRVLCEWQANIHFVLPDSGGYTPLHIASKYGHMDVVRLLLATRAELETTLDDGATALCIACRCGCSEVVEELLWQNADPSKGAWTDGTPLHIASGSGQIALVSMLLEVGADPSCANCVGGWNPLHLAHMGLLPP